ncbi:MAG: alpha/beta hydrolase family protein [Nitrosomonas sp.]|nr:alpha/beta hydrolase family protein [Nitrosomonas sp.]
MQKFFINGPAGKIETILAEPKTQPRGIAVVAHPHPLHGGTMDNKVVYTLFNSALALAYIAVKFNFRGVNKSEGSFDNGIGEVEDVIAVTRTIQNQFSGHSGNLPLLLAGFSFGGGVQIQAAAHLKPESLVLVAPSLKYVSTPDIPENIEHTLIIQGDRDEIVPFKTVIDWATPQSLPIVVIPGAEHFFHGKLTLLKQVVQNFHRI